jgi:minor extracellular protease Epr
MNLKIKLTLLALFCFFITLFIAFGGNKWELLNPISAVSTSKYDNWGIQLVGTLNENKGSRIIKVGILDSGIYKEHKEFKETTFKEYNAIDPSVPIVDDFGHGTAVAGIIASRGVEIQGVNNKLELYDVKVLNEKGSGKIEHIIKGIEWCIKQNVDIINISFGFPTDYPELKTVIDKAIQSNIIVVAASGNTMGVSVDYPAKYPGVLSVSSFNKEKKFDPLSAKGKIDYSAPGVNVTSTNNRGGYSGMNGTSFATAYATGAISALISMESLKDYKNIEQTLQKYTIDLGDKGFDSRFGNGVITLIKGD